MNIESQLPLVSCICVTQNRPELLFKSILSFDQQTYPNKELIISYPNTDEKTRLLVNYFSDNTGISILKIEREESESIGKARNTAIENSNGDYICIWDDDDIFHQTRIAQQYNVLLLYNGQFRASVISEILLYHAFEQTAYLSFPSHWACTLFCDKKIFVDNRCTDDNQFELRSVLFFLNSTNQLLSIAANPSFYIYVFHGKNLMKYISFLYIVNQSYPIPKEVSENLKNYINLKVEYPINNGN